MAVLIGLLAGIAGAAEPLSHFYWNTVYKFDRRSAPQSIVLLSVDDHPNWTSAQQAVLLERLRGQIPKRVFFDARMNSGMDAAGDKALAQAIKAYDDGITFVARSEKADQWGGDVIKLPSRQLIGNAKVALSAWRTNFVFFPESAPYSIEITGHSYPTFSTEMAGVHSGIETNYYPDFSVDPDTILQFSSGSLLSGELAPGVLAGRTVIVTAMADYQPLGYFGHQTRPPVAFDIAGAEGLTKPVSTSLPGFSFLPLLALVAGLILAGSRSRARRLKSAFYGLAIVATIGLPLMLRMSGLVIAPDGAMVTLLFYFSFRLWQKRTRRIQHTSASGLPNLLALSAAPLGVGQDVVVAVIARYEEIMATLPKDLHGECAQQIARRLSVGSGGGDIYHGDGGHFAWTEEARPLEMQLSHLEGLRALFSAPLQIGPHTFDTNIHFGLDRNEGLDSLTRVNSALASANEALVNGRSIELFEANRLAEAPWELSLHARIDEGLRNGDIWLAFQSQWDLRTQTMCGAEALIRWNHPTRGPIAPDAFILQAERAGRIDALTYWVLNEAITAALELNAMGERFQMSVNLSAQMVDKPDLVANFAEIVDRRGIDASLLTVEVTETSSVRNRPAAVHNLTQLRNLGFRLSIDDFGTGEASLAYLADLPSDELKLDRRFVSRIMTSDRDHKIVLNTVALAHALGQAVVAEGIEDGATYHMLRAMGCDMAQGYFLGRPQPFAAFVAGYVESRVSQIGIV
jgi:EAL domain-containing protein (putative c-di-GMP-specific phosphodiesterase class I)